MWTDAGNAGGDNDDWGHDDPGDADEDISDDEVAVQGVAQAVQRTEVEKEPQSYAAGNEGHGVSQKVDRHFYQLKYFFPLWTAENDQGRYSFDMRAGGQVKF